MKRNNKKLTTLILAGALSLSAVLGTALLKAPVTASADEATAKTYSLTNLFTESEATVSAETLNGESAQTTKFSFNNTAKTNSVTLKRNIAFKWFAGKNQPKYFTMTFAFGDLKNFKSADFAINSDSSLTSEKAENIVRFEMSDSGVCVYVVADGMTEDEIKAAKASALSLPGLTAGTEVTLSFTEDKPEGADESFAYAYDEFGVKLAINGSEKVIGTFTHLGSKYASNALKISAVAATTGHVEYGAANPVVYLDEINGQKFNNITTEGEGSAAKLMVTDTAAPVVVANEVLNGFLLGAKYTFDYTVVDVLQNASLGDVDKYYQFNPADTATSYTALGTTYFMDTVYYVDANGNYTKDATTNDVANVPCSVYRHYGVDGVVGGNEYVSIQVTVNDDTYKNESGDYAKVVYDLAWYAEEGATQVLTVGTSEVEFIKVNTSKTGAVYSYIGIDDENKVNVITEENKAILDLRVAAYNAALAEKAKTVYAGSNSTIELPSLDWLFEDDNGYSGLKFSFAYKTQTSSGLTKNNLEYNRLKLPTTSVGSYEFKVLATDKSGNAMKYYLDGELVDVTTANIWDIEEIPVFKFSVQNQGLRVKEDAGADDSDRTDKENLNKTFTLSSFTVEGGTNQSSAFILYKVDRSAYNATVSGSEKELTRKLLASISYEELRTEMLKSLYLVNDKSSEYYENYFALYKDTYAKLLAAEIGGNADKIAECFVEIKAYDAAADQADNKYEWKKSSSTSFKTVEEGEYMIFADYWDSLLPTTSRAVGYMLVVVESEIDTIKGETEWLKNNMVSVILFGIAGVMLILIIILLLIKPSDETLEDVEKAAKKKEKAKKSK